MMEKKSAANQLSLQTILSKAVLDGGSDIHIVAGLPPIVRKVGSLSPIEGYEKLMPPDTMHLCYSVMTASV